MNNLTFSGFFDPLPHGRQVVGIVNLFEEWR